MKKQLQLALVGTGSIASRYANEIIHNRGAILRAVTSLSLEQTHKFIDAHQAAFSSDCVAYENLVNLLHDPVIDGVLVCTWHNSHISIGMQCLLAGKSVFMEKPLALRSVDCIPLARANVQSKLVFMMGGFGFRYYNGNVFRLLNYIKQPMIIRGRFISPRWPDNFWALKSDIGGGVIFSMGSHLMDMACLVSRSEPTQLMAFGRNITHPDNGIVDVMSVIIEFENGVTASLAFGDCGEVPPLGEMTLEVFDGIRSVSIPQFLPTDLTPTFHQSRGYFDECELVEESAIDLAGRPLTPIDDFITAILTGKPSELFPTIKDGIRAIVLLEKAFKAIKLRKPQRIERCSPINGYYK
jgi:predicted dehydrogenase